MKLIYNIIDFIFKIFNILLAILIIGLLALIIKWKSDTLFLESISDTEINFGLLDEIEKTKQDIASYFYDEEPEESVEMVSVEQNYIDLSIPKDSSLDQIADQLLSKRLMTDKAAFKALVHDMGLENQFKPGTYQIPGGTKIKDTILKLTDTKEKEYTILVEEGDDGFKLAKKLQAAGIIESSDTFVQKLSEQKLYYSIKPGEYKIVTPLRNSKLIEQLTK